MILNYVSNFARGQRSGGWDGMNAAIADRLERHFAINYCGPISPRVSGLARARGLLRRKLGLGEPFHFFSNSRLGRYASLAMAEMNPEAAADWFHGCTPWVGVSSGRPYFTYVDATFLVYMRLYHATLNVDPSELRRISELERQWMAKAARVFFSSRWAMNETRKMYATEGVNFEVMGLGGCINIPASDQYTGGMNFICVATDFDRKGGRIAVEAFVAVRKRNPAATLTLVGGAPPSDIARTMGVSYAGYIDKSNPQSGASLADLYSKAFALLLPTSADLTPLVILEAGYFGCPTIAPASFGIPEMIDDRVSGLLTSAPATTEALASAMFDLSSDAAAYARMRREVRKRCVSEFTWDRVATLMARRVIDSIG